MPSNFYDDFVIDEVYEHPLGRTITATDNAWFSLLTMNTNQLHFNDHYAQASTYGQQLVNSALTLAVVLGLSVSDISLNAVCNLGWEDVTLPCPVFVGDTLYAKSIILSKRVSESRPYAGIVKCRTLGLKQDGAVCINFTRSVLIYKRDAAPKSPGLPDHGALPRGPAETSSSLEKASDDRP